MRGGSIVLIGTHHRFMLLFEPTSNAQGRTIEWRCEAVPESLLDSLRAAAQGRNCGVLKPEAGPI